MAHHATPELLLDYASGALPAAPAMAIASHMALCPEVSADYTALNRLGGAMLETLEDATPIEAREMAAMLARLDEPAPIAAPTPADPRATLPRPLQSLIGQPLDTLRWRRVAPGVREHKLPLDDGRHKAVLLLIAPGQAVPRHSHRGQELTLVLEGGYRDGDLDFARGDLQVADDTVDHRPVADPHEGCICLVVLDAPIRFTGPWARWINGLVRY